MDEKKNVILAVALSAIVLIGWNMWEASRQPPPPTEAEIAAQQQAAQSGGAPEAPVSSAGGQEIPSAPGAPALPSELNANVLSRSAALDASPRIAIETPRLMGSINLKGGRLDDLTLKGYYQTLEEDSPLIDLLHPTAGANPYFIEFGWSPAEKDAVEVPGKDTVWTASGGRLSVDNPVTLSWTNGAGVTFEQRFEVDENYLVTVNQSVTNGGSEPVQLLPYGRVLRTGRPEILDFYILHEGLIGVFDEVLEEVDYADLVDERTKSRTYQSTGGWMGITDKYWHAVLIPDQSLAVNSRMVTWTQEGREVFQVDFLTGAQTVAPGASAERTSRAFAGAKETLLLDKYGEEYGIVNFDLAVDFGWFYFLTKPIFYAIHWLFGVLGNFGLAILALTVVIKLAFFPLANKSYKSMSKMKLLQPKVVELRERYGDDKQKLNQEMMGLYKKEKVNPLSGCLPIIVQIPVFFALYKVLFVTIEMRHAPFYGWIEDLSAKDPTGIMTLFGLIPWNVPPILDVANLGIWPIIMGITMWAQQKLNPPPADPIQQKIFTWMPFFFTFLLASFPAGLVIYWAWNNTLSMLQQYVIMRRMGVAIGGGRADDAT